MNTSNVSEKSISSLAFELGAAVEFDGGRVFNASGIKGELPSRAKPTPPADDWNRKLLEKLVDAASKPEQPVVIQHPATPARPVEWTFVFNRNNDGTLKSITAKPQL